MKTTHADEQTIQQFVFDAETCSNAAVEHIQSCDLCLEIADGYKALSQELKEQETPQLDFNLEELVLQRISAQLEQTHAPKAYTYAGPLIVIALGVLALLSKTIVSDVESLIGLNESSTYMILSIGLVVTALLCMDAIGLFKSKLNKINFSSLNCNI